MKSTSSSSLPSEKEQIPIEEALRTIQSGLEKVDAERGLAFGTLGILRAAKSNQIDRHQALLARKLGPEHPRVMALQAESDLIKRQLPEIRAAQVQAVTPAPTVEPAGYAVHGFVRTVERKPIPKVIVAIHDKGGEKRKDFDSATTDVDGHFSVATPQLFGATRVSAESPKPVALDVRVFDGRKLLQHSSPALAALPGQIDFREILVVGDAKSATAPEFVPRTNPRATLQIIADGLSKNPVLGGVEKTSATARQKSRAKNAEKENRPNPPETKSPRKKKRAGAKKT
jgi:hypothetical protein